MILEVTTQKHVTAGSIFHLISFCVIGRLLMFTHYIYFHPFTVAEQTFQATCLFLSITDQMKYLQIEEMMKGAE